MRFSKRIAQLLDEAGDITAVTFEGRAYSWATLADLAKPLAASLQRADPEGKAVALVLRNRPSGVAAMASVLMCRRTACEVTPIQPSLSLCADIRSLNPGVVIADRQDWSAALDEAAHDCGAAGVEIFEAEDHSLGVAPRAGLAKTAAGHPPMNVAIPEAGIMVPTSGTTGPPKRIPIRWDKIDSYADKDRPIVQNHGVIQTNPLVTVGATAVILTCLSKPLNLVLMEKLDVVKWADLVAEHKPRRAGLPPAGLRMLTESDVPKEKFASLEAFVTGSAPFPPDQIAALEARFGKPLLYSYGATEFGGTGNVAGWTLELYQAFRPAKLGSAGRALAGVKLKVVDPDTEAELPVGEQGVLMVHKPDAPAPRPDGWIRTTDLAIIDEDGFLFIKGRSDDTVIRGGFKVPLAEVEAVISQHPAVFRCAAIGVPDHRLGQVPVAAVVLRDDYPGEITERDIIVWCHERLSPYKVPTRIKFVQDIPVTQLLKVSRPQMQLLFAD